MTGESPGRRFYQAVERAAGAVGLSDHVPELLVRFGLPGLSPHPADPAARRLHQLADTLALEEARRIGALLDAHVEDHFFAKGVALLGRIYRPGDRTISDLDLYVPPGAGPRVVERLGALGYAPVPEHEQSGPPALRSSLALTRSSGAAPAPATVDLHWAADPVTRLLPRSDRPWPARFWTGVAAAGDGLRVPAPAHHAALLVHHLVHSDLAHVRSALDVALLLQGLGRTDLGEYVRAAGELGVERFARSMAGLVARDLGITGALAAAAPVSWSLDQWLVQVARTPPDDDAFITRRRIATRLRVLGWRAAPALLADALLPPAAFLAWRWPGMGIGGARVRHYGQVIRKATRSSP